MTKKSIKKSIKKSNSTKEVQPKFKRLTDKEFKELERQVHEDNFEFEENMCGVLNRRAWADLLKSAIKSHSKSLSKEHKNKLECIAKSAVEICEDDAIELSLAHFSGDISRRRKTLSIERSLRLKEKGGKMCPEEKLLAEVFSE